MLRGVIVELEPERFVLLMLPTGEHRRIPMEQIVYAGPVDREPAETPQPPSETTPATPPAAQPPGPPQSYGAPPLPNHARLKLTATEPDLTFYTRTGAGTGTAWMGPRPGIAIIEQYERICTAPCETQIERGTYAMGVAKEDGRPVAADGAVRVGQDATLEASYQSYSGMRVAGWTIFGGSMILGPTLVVLSFTTTDCDTLDPNCSPMNVPLMVTGIAVSSVGVLVGLLMAMKSDAASIRQVAVEHRPRLPQPRTAHF